jgi:hypothetical protein
VYTLGLDFHGVIDKFPELFSALTKAIMGSKGQVYVITGAKASPELIKALENYGIEYTGILSIVDYHIKIGTLITYDGVGNPWLDNTVWDTTKAKFCEDYKVDLHIDDSKTYGKYFTGKTKYLLLK